MLPDLSPTHILIVVVVALIVVGPKELPFLLRKIGKFMGKMRGMANEFRASFDEMARQSELDELRKEVEAMRNVARGAIPHDLNFDSTNKTDAEGAYMAEWQASQAAAPEPFLPGLDTTGASLSPPTTVEHAPPSTSDAPHEPAPVMTGKPADLPPADLPPHGPGA